jgi:hypothetical protein
VKDGARAPIQDGNREWATIMPTICADGTILPTSIILPSEAYDIHSCHQSNQSISASRLELIEESLAFKMLGLNCINPIKSINP